MCVKNANRLSVRQNVSKANSVDDSIYSNTLTKISGVFFFFFFFYYYKFERLNILLYIINILISSYFF